MASGGVGPLEELRAATAAAEREVDQEVAAVQESLAGRRVLAAPPRNGEAVAPVWRSLRVLLCAADARGSRPGLGPDMRDSGADGTQERRGEGQSQPGRK